MENRVFGCPEFSDVIFNSSLALLEKILDHVLDDPYVQEVSSNYDETKKVLKIGFYANEQSRTLDVMVETFEDDVVY